MTGNKNEWKSEMIGDENDATIFYLDIVTFQDISCFCFFILRTLISYLCQYIRV